MGPLILPASGLVYVDTQILIYTVEGHPVFGPLLRPLWEAVQRSELDVVTSELSVMETQIGPLKSGDVALGVVYDEFLRQPGVRLEPIHRDVLLEAARLRATTKLRTPDAIHLATARCVGCALLLTNDDGFRNVGGLPLFILHDAVTP